MKVFLLGSWQVILLNSHYLQKFMFLWMQVCFAISSVENAVIPFQTKKLKVP